MAQLIDSSDAFYTSFEPKTKNRFIMYIDGIPSYTVKTSKRPSFSSEANVIDHLNINFKVKGGKNNWEDIDVTLYDPIVPSSAQAVMEWIRLSAEEQSGRNGYADFYKKDITIAVLGPVGDIVEQWILKGAFITKADFGDLDQSEGGVQMITFTLAMDYATLSY